MISSFTLALISATCWRSVLGTCGGGAGGADRGSGTTCSCTAKPARSRSLKSLVASSPESTATFSPSIIVSVEASMLRSLSDARVFVA